MQILCPKLFLMPFFPLDDKPGRQFLLLDPKDSGFDVISYYGSPSLELQSGGVKIWDLYT
jgi:hypothetical protein